MMRDYLTASTLTFFGRGESRCTRVERLFDCVDANFFRVLRDVMNIELAKISDSQNRILENLDLTNLQCKNEL